MKKITIGIIVGVVIIAAAGFLIFKKTPQAPVSSRFPQATSEQTTTPTPPGGASFDTNDNLDQALEDLNQIE